MGKSPILHLRKSVYLAIKDNNARGICLLYPTTRVVLDSTEIFVQTPTSLSQLYSSYKSNNTLKGLIVGITPHGAVSFIS